MSTIGFRPTGDTNYPIDGNTKSTSSGSSAASSNAASLGSSILGAEKTTSNAGVNKLSSAKQEKPSEKIAALRNDILKFKKEIEAQRKDINNYNQTISSEKTTIKDFKELKKMKDIPNTPDYKNFRKGEEQKFDVEIDASKKSIMNTKNQLSAAKNELFQSKLNLFKTRLSHLKTEIQSGETFKSTLSSVTSAFGTSKKQPVLTDREQKMLDKRDEATQMREDQPFAEDIQVKNPQGYNAKRGINLPKHGSLDEFSKTRIRDANQNLSDLDKLDTILDHLKGYFK